jgi:peptidase E
VSTHAIYLSSLVFLSWFAACDGSPETGTPGDPSLSSVEVSRENFKTEIEATLDCTAAGGEIIDVSGTLHVADRSIQKEDGFLYIIANSSAQGITGIGRSTGATYQAPGMGLFKFEERLDPTSGQFTTFDLIHLVRTGPGGDGTLWGAKIMYHISTTPTGHVTERLVEVSDCVAL